MARGLLPIFSISLMRQASSFFDRLALQRQIDALIAFVDVSGGVSQERHAETRPQMVEPLRQVLLADCLGRPAEKCYNVLNAEWLYKR